MLPDRVSNPGPLTYESGALPTALRGPACLLVKIWYVCVCDCKSCSALKKVKTGRIYTYVYVLLTLVLSNNYILKLFSSQQ